MTTLELIERGIGHNCLSDAYDMGRADQLEEQKKGKWEQMLIELGKKEGRTDAITELKGKKDEIIRWLIKRDKEGYGTTNGELLEHILEIAEQLRRGTKK